LILWLKVALKSFHHMFDKSLLWFPVWVSPISPISWFLVSGIWNSEIGQQMTGSDQVQGSFYYR
jgi:hypothetical protein